MKDGDKTKEQLIKEIRILRRRQFLNELILNTIPSFAMIIRKDRTILLANRIAQKVGAKVGGYCWRNFGQGKFIPEQDKKYIKEHKKIPPGGTCCYFCLADKALKTQKPANNPELKAWDKIWDTFWIPLNKELFLHYAIDITRRREAERVLEDAYQQLVESNNNLSRQRKVIGDQ
jgi:hypothetical protein